MITLDMVKEWLRLDHDDFDGLVEDLLDSAKRICADILRLENAEELEVTPLTKIAILYAMAYLFEHREDPDLNALKTNLRSLLESDRKAAF